MHMRHAAVVAGLALGLMSGAAKAAYMVDFEQVGANVVATGTGSIDTSQFTLFQNVVSQGFVGSRAGAVVVGSGSTEALSGNILGPGGFGTGFATAASSSTGAAVGLFDNLSQIRVPSDYKTGTNLGVSKATFDNRTLALLGLTLGTKAVYQFPGQNESFDTFTVTVGALSAVPLPSSAPMFGAALVALGAVGYGLKRKGKAAA